MKRACLILALLPAWAGAQSLRLDGEVFARSSEQVAPPAIPNVWNLNITEFAPDGAPLKPGDMVVVFDGGETQNQLVTVRIVLPEAIDDELSYFLSEWRQKHKYDPGRP